MIINKNLEQMIRKIIRKYPRIFAGSNDWSKVAKSYCTTTSKILDKAYKELIKKYEVSTRQLQQWAKKGDIIAQIIIDNTKPNSRRKIVKVKMRNPIAEGKRPEHKSKERWDKKLKLGRKVDLVMKAGWITNKGKLSKLGERIAESKWEKLSPAAQKILDRKIAEFYKLETIGNPKKEKPFDELKYAKGLLTHNTFPKNEIAYYQGKLLDIRSPHGIPHKIWQQAAKEVGFTEKNLSSHNGQYWIKRTEKVNPMTYREAKKLPKGGAVEMGPEHMLGTAAEIIGHRFAMTPKVIYDWAVKHHINLSDFIRGKYGNYSRDEKTINKFTEAVVLDKSLVKINPIGSLTPRGILNKLFRQKVWAWDYENDWSYGVKLFNRKISGQFIRLFQEGFNCVFSPTSIGDVLVFDKVRRNPSYQLTVGDRPVEHSASFDQILHEYKRRARKMGETGIKAMKIKTIKNPKLSGVSKALETKFVHPRWYKTKEGNRWVSYKTKADALDEMAKSGDFYLDKKINYKKTDIFNRRAKSIFDEETVYDDILRYGGKERGSYRLSPIEKKYYLERKKYWDSFKDSKKTRTVKKNPRGLELLAKKAREFENVNDFINQRIEIGNLGETIDFVKRHRFSSITDFYNQATKKVNSKVKGVSKKLPEYFVVILDLHSGKMIILPVKTKVYPFIYKGLKLFAHRLVKSPNSWKVTEQTTGLAIGFGDTKKEAIKETKRMLDKIHKHDIKESISKGRRELKKLREAL